MSGPGGISDYQGAFRGPYHCFPRLRPFPSAQKSAKSAQSAVRPFAAFCASCVRQRRDPSRRGAPRSDLARGGAFCSLILRSAIRAISVICGQAVRSFSDNPGTYYRFPDLRHRRRAGASRRDAEAQGILGPYGWEPVCSLRRCVSARSSSSGMGGGELQSRFRPSCPGGSFTACPHTRSPLVRMPPRRFVFDKEHGEW
jgi:hypothetical protein